MKQGLEVGSTIGLNTLCSLMGILDLLQRNCYWCSSYCMKRTEVRRREEEGRELVG